MYEWKECKLHVGYELSMGYGLQVDSAVKLDHHIILSNFFFIITVIVCANQPTNRGHYTNNNHECMQIILKSMSIEHAALSASYIIIIMHATESYF